MKNTKLVKAELLKDGNIVPVVPNVEIVPVVSSDIVESIKDLSVALIDTSAKLNMTMLAEKLNEVIEKINAINAPGTHKPRNRGPASQRQMTEQDAERVMLGDMKDLSHMEAAQELGLSYGQIYSARKGFCFKPTYQKMVKLVK